jgi:hypothetical protein
MVSLPVISVSCAELTVDEQLALEVMLGDALGGRALVLNKGDEIVLDQLTDDRVTVGDVLPTVERFVSKRKDSQLYRVVAEGQKLVVSSADPVAAARSRKENRARTVPPNLKQCPFCGFVTPYEEMYIVHVRAHGFGF